MALGFIGLGRMGQSLVARLLAASINVIGFDPYLDTLDFNIDGRQSPGSFIRALNIEEVACKSRVIWLMVPAGEVVDHVINELLPHLHKGDILIDGGNSFYQDSIRRYERLKTLGISFLDCGTSGGLQGREIGFCLMVGGDRSSYDRCVSFFKAVAAPHGYAYMGAAGAGHYVKMVHNGIEYGLLQAYAEGFHILKDGAYKNLDLDEIAQLWNQGSVIRSWILELTHKVFTADYNLDDISGAIGENKTGLWTVEDAKKRGIPVDVIDTSLKVRAESRKTGGNFATKLVALLRNMFGGHPLIHS